MRTTLIALAVVAVVAAAAAAAEPPLTNADVVKLVKAGVSTDVILAKIKSSEVAFATDADSLVALANEKVPDEVIRAMVARTAPAAPTSAPAGTPKAEVTKVVVQGIYRTRGICTARGDVTLTPAGFEFKPIEKSPVCSEDAFGKSSAAFAWSDVKRLCFEYAASGTVEVWLNDGDDMSFKSSRGGMEDLAARMKSVHPDLPVRCEE